MKRHGIAIGLVGASLAAACVDTPTALLQENHAEFLIADAAHDAAITGFYFLPPLVRNPVTSGPFDATRWPRVEICALVAEQPPTEEEPEPPPPEEEKPEEPPSEEEPPPPSEDKDEEPPVEEDLEQPPTEEKGTQPPVEEEGTVSVGCGAEAIAGFTMDAGSVQLHADHYQVDWQTADFDLDPAGTYRIYVIEGTVERGFADVDVVSSGQELKSVDTGEYIPLLDGRTLPIRFRLEGGP